MSAEPVTSVELQIQLKRSQFKTPIEIIKKNFKNLQKIIEKHNSQLGKSIKSLETKKTKNAQLETLKKIIQQQESFNKKLSFRVKQHNEFINRLQLRLSKLKELKDLNDSLNELPSKKEIPKDLTSQINKFYKDEINLIVIDFLLKTSEKNINISKADKNPGVKLAKDLEMDKLIDFDVILQGLTIYNEIKLNKNLKILIDWCSENRKNLKLIKENSKFKINLEFETHFQEFIEKIKLNELFEALEIANKYLIGYLNESSLEEEMNGNGDNDGYDDNDDDDYNDDDDGYSFNKITSGAALLWWNAFKKNELFEKATSLSPLGFYDSNTRQLEKVKANVKPYEDLLNDLKWTKLADFFLYNFNSLYGIDQDLPILTLLSIGGSSLKTKSCIHADHSLTKHNENDIAKFDELLELSTNKNSLFASECPICSIDLLELTMNLPFSHQVKSNIYDKPVLLPNGNIYEYDKLLKLSETYGKHTKNEKQQQQQQQKRQKRQSHDTPLNDPDDDDDDGDVNNDYDDANDDLNNFDESERKEAMDFGMESINSLEEFKIRDPFTGEEFEKKDMTLVFPP